MTRVKSIVLDKEWLAMVAAKLKESIWNRSNRVPWTVKHRKNKLTKSSTFLRQFGCNANATCLPCWCKMLLLCGCQIGWLNPCKIWFLYRHNMAAVLVQCMQSTALVLAQYGCFTVQDTRCFCYVKAWCSCSNSSVLCQELAKLKCDVT